MIVVESSPTSPDAAALIAELDAELSRRYPGHEPHGIDAVSLVASGGAFLLARLGDDAVGCGALRPLGANIAEIKRMYVRPDARGRGIARAVLERLERIAAERGYKTVRLETGNRQPEALALYASSGYSRIPNYAESVHPLSLCFEKRLA